MLGRHVEQLVTDADWMHDNGRASAGAILDVFAVEQAASFAILLDLVRGGWSIGDASINEQIRRFYDHLSRGLYAAAYEGCPATLGELERFLDVERRSRFLDGPSDMDWILPNEIIEGREGLLYVDYVCYEHGCEWASPLERDHSYRHIPKIVDLVGNLRAVGICDSDALADLATVWSEVDISDRNLHWQTVYKANQEVLSRLTQRCDKVEQTQLRRILNDWIHPLNFLAMSRINVSLTELQSQRESWLRSQYDY
jgi:hypothetical protein